jgi:hypothetical protein
MIALLPRQGSAIGGSVLHEWFDKLPPFTFRPTDFAVYITWKWPGLIEVIHKILSVFLIVAEIEEAHEFAANRLSFLIRHADFQKEAFVQAGAVVTFIAEQSSVFAIRYVAVFPLKDFRRTLAASLLKFVQFPIWLSPNIGAEPNKSGNWNADGRLHFTALQTAQVESSQASKSVLAHLGDPHTG